MVPRYNRISEEMRNLVIKFVKEDFKSQREVARILLIPKSTVNRIIKKHERPKEITTPIPGGSRRKVITQQIKDRIQELMNDDLTTNLREIRDMLGVEVTLKTIWKWVTDLGFTYKLVRPIQEKRNTMQTKIARQDYVR
ncbi:hypothetical protein RF11_02013 [Thelohanellus kitauei]|uniref:Paired domain-containing protein n=1 Tax=Thelohanellus kitauei TaxID=669202 RepID=A0A0C2MLC4_THEKT|nr:hypothetical protein RF11_02013 [Thelohanellus kitauei]